MSDINTQIKQMENEKREKMMKKVSSTTRVSFDAWYHIRSSAIPKHHMKEIIWADFKARGLKSEASMEQYDAALNKYGIKI